LKQYHQGNEFTRENLLEHSKRMNMEREVTANASSESEA
jgi:hypothetical protein